MLRQSIIVCLFCAGNLFVAGCLHIGSFPVSSFPHPAPIVIEDSDSWKNNLGKIVSLDDERFSFENGQLGYWNPQKFIDDKLGGLYFLHKYSPQKRPVIFVHGGLGHSGAWKEVIQNLDGKKFQAWLFFFPSGQKIEQIANNLVRTVTQLKKELLFDQVDLVTHSLGGLVGQRAINDTQEEIFGQFIAIATPWGGHPEAIMKMKQAPQHIPSWQDMRPKSAFLRTLHAEAGAPSNLSIIFGYKGDARFIGENNDGVTSLASVLDSRAQQRASHLYALNETHSSLLKSPDTFKIIEDVLTEQE